MKKKEHGAFAHRQIYYILYKYDGHEDDQDDAEKDEDAHNIRNRFASISMLYVYNTHNP